MENGRIYRLLLSEYKELAKEAILVESPFAETTRDGRGIREVALGLTRSQLIIASDILRSNRAYRYPSNLDPSIESLELISIYPLELVTLSVFRKRRRRTLKARLIDGRAKYYELGGMERKRKIWSLWCKHIRDLLDSKCIGSSLSETTIAASSTCPSTRYAISSGFEYDSTSGRCRENRRRNTSRRCRGGAGDAPVWTHKNLYLGPSYEELQDGHYAPVPIRFADATYEEIKDELKDCSKTNSSSKCNDASLSSNDKSSNEPRRYNLCNVIFVRKNDRRCVDQRLLAEAIKRNLNPKKRHELLDFQPDYNELTKGQSLSVVLDIQSPESNVFTITYDEDKTSVMSTTKNRSSKLLKKVESSVNKLVCKLSRFGFGIDENCSSNLCSVSCKNQSTNRTPVNFRELIESGVAVWEGTKNCENQPFRKKKKKHLRRYGISTATYFLHALGPWSVQPGDRESVQSRRSHSCVVIRRQPAEFEFRLPISRRQLAASVSLTDLNAGLTVSSRGPVVLFWTPDYWYRPRAAIDAYREIRKHLAIIKQYRIEQEIILTKKQRIFGRMRSKKLSQDKYNEVVYDQESSGNLKRSHTSSGTTSYLRRLLKLDFRVTLWDLDSTTLARQLTLIDRELLLRLPRLELEKLARQRTSRDAPNLGAWIAFAHRVSCLVASDVLAAKEVETRARLIARLLNAAIKCLDMGNFHSARSLLAGLQSPALYRLKETWTYLKAHHATRYETMQKLGMIFKSTRTKSYRKSWSKAEKNPPLIPYVGDLLARLLQVCNDVNYSRRNLPNINVKTMRDKSKNASRKEKPESHSKHSSARWNCSSLGTKIKFDSPINEVHEKRHNERHNDKWNDINQVADWLESCQCKAKAYNFPSHSLAWEFLLKARYREDRDNFFESLRIEPPRNL